MSTKTDQLVRKLEWLALLVFTMFCGTRVGAAQYFYSVDFDGLPHQVGQPPATAAGPETPSSVVVGNPMVVSSFGQLTKQPLVFSAVNYEQIQFDLGKGMSDYFVDFDFETHNLNPSLFAFTILFDAPFVQNFYLHGIGYIEGPPANSPPLSGGWVDGVPHHMHIAIDLVASSWMFQLDNQTPVTGPFSHLGDISSMRMNLSTWRSFTPDDPSVQVAVDNIRIGTSVPEPSGIALVVSGLGVWLLARRKKCQA